jgi:hypothetical protein
MYISASPHVSSTNNSSQREIQYKYTSQSKIDHQGNEFLIKMAAKATVMVQVLLFTLLMIGTSTMHRVSAARPSRILQGHIHATPLIFESAKSVVPPSVPSCCSSSTPVKGCTCPPTPSK